MYTSDLRLKLTQAIRLSRHEAKQFPLLLDVMKSKE